MFAELVGDGAGERIAGLGILIDKCEFDYSVICFLRFDVQFGHTSYEEFSKFN